MKIDRLEVSNVKGIAHVKVDGLGNKNVILITGPNGAGKSSLWEAMVSLLPAGKSLPAIRKGAEKGEASVKLTNGWTLTRKFGKSAGLTGSPGPGQTFSSPKAATEALIGAMGVFGLDPERLEKMAPKDRRILLAKMAGIDLVVVDSASSTARYEAGEAKREVDRLERAIAGRLLDPEAPKELVDVAELSQMLEEANSHNSQFEGLRLRRQNAQMGLDATEKQIETLKQQLEAAEAHAKTLREEVAKWDAQLEAGVPMETDPIREQIAKAEETNAAVRANRQLDADLAALAKAQLEAEAKADVVNTLKEDLLKQLGAADFGMEGLSLGDDDMALGGVDYPDLSESERARLGTALALFAAKQDGEKLDVVYVSNGWAHDKKHREAMYAQAQALGVQYFIEFADHAPEGEGDVVISIEEGEVKNA